MAQVILKTGIATADGKEEVLREYLCDWPGCPNIATHVLGFTRELATTAVVCDEHASATRHDDDSTSVTT